MREQNPEIEELSSEGYSFDTLIGTGSVGAVYKATAPDGSYVAIKVMDETPFMDTDLLKSIVEGALLTQKISQKANIVTVYRAGRFDKGFFIVMDFMKGGTLENYLSTPGRSLNELINQGLSILDTLQYVHQAGIVHGDIKPSNILMDGNGVAYLNDFYHASEKVRALFSGVGTPQGTPKYMSPEQASGRFISVKSDIYSFGVLFYEMLTKHAPYREEATNITNMLELIQESPIIAPSSFNRKIDNKLEAIMLKCLEKKPEGRYKDVTSLTEDMRACLTGKELSIPYKRSLMNFFRRFF